VDFNTRNCDKTFLVMALCSGRAFNTKFYSRLARDRICVYVFEAMAVLKYNTAQNKNSIDYSLYR